MGRKRTPTSYEFRINFLEQQLATLITHNHMLTLTDEVNESLRKDWLTAVEELRLDVAALDQQIQELEFEQEERADG